MDPIEAIQALQAKYDALQGKYNEMREILEQLAVYAVEDHSYGCRICGAISPEGERLYHSHECILA